MATRSSSGPGRGTSGRPAPAAAGKPRGCTLPGAGLPAPNVPRAGPNLLVRYLNQGRADAPRSHLSPRKAARLLLTRPENLTDGRRETAERIASACPEMKALAGLIRSFAAMLDPDPANETKLLQWMAGARAD